MSTPNLTERDLVVLVALSDAPADADALACRTDVPRLDERLAVLTDNGLVREADGTYDLTDSGRRVIRAPSDGTADDSIDAPAAVRDALRARDLRADRLDAVLGAFAFLRYWGAATGAEIADGVFSEVPLDYRTPTEWWGFVRDHLAAVPTVDPPATDDGFWRFTGTPGAADRAKDGRNRLFGRGSGERTYASATEAMVAMELADDRRRAVAAGLAALQDGDEVGTDAIRAALPDDAGDPADLLETLARLPGIARSSDRWRYTLTPEGYE